MFWAQETTSFMNIHASKKGREAWVVILCIEASDWIIMERNWH